MAELLGIGIVTVDDFLFADHFPQVDSKLRLQGERREMGGLTAVALVAAARLGAGGAYCAVLGEDPLSQFCVQTLEAEGIDCGPVLRRAGARPIHAYIVVDTATGSRTILFTTAGSQMVPAEWISQERVRRAKALLVDMMAGEAGLRAARIARRWGIPVVGDFESLQYPYAAEVIAEVDHLIVGRNFAAELSGCAEPPQMAQALAVQAGRACAVVTAGAQGCWYAVDGQEARHFPAFAVEAVNTTGCGDVFHGAYAASLVRGEGLEERIRLASAAAALKAASAGGIAGIPRRTEVEEFIRNWELSGSGTKDGGAGAGL